MIDAAWPDWLPEHFVEPQSTQSCPEALAGSRCGMAEPDSETLQRAGVKPWMVDAVAKLARADERSLAAQLTVVGDPVVIEATGATCRCRFVTRDGNGRPMVDALAKRLAGQVVDFCIPRSRIDEAHDFFVRTRSTEKLVALDQEARALFTQLATSGEGGELLLYVLLEVELGLPQLLCKMPHKTDAQMHVHGTDGVHGKLLDDGRLALYWGEAKLYDDAAAAVRRCFDDLAPYLLDEGDGESQRDLLLAREHVDTGDPALTAALRRFFEQDTLESTRVEVRAAALVGFDVTDYPMPFGDDGQTIADDVAAAMADWHDKIGTRIARNKIEAFDIEVFCLPVPSVAALREAVRRHLSLA